MVQKKEFMMLFRFEPNFNYQPSEAEIAEMQKHWGAYIGNLAIQEKLVSTYQLGFEGAQIAADGSLSQGLHISQNQTLGGNMIVRAESMAEVIELAKGCPILTMGGNVEIRNIQAM